MALAHWVLSAMSMIMFAGAEDTLFTGETLLANEYIESQNGLYQFIMQGDCNLVLYVKQNDTNKALWDSKTAGRGNTCNLLLKTNGELVVTLLSDVLWSSSTNRGLDNCRLIVQNDGNVVIYGAAFWNTGTFRKSKI